MRVSVTVRPEIRLDCTRARFSSVGGEAPPQPTATSPTSAIARRTGEAPDHERTPELTTKRCLMTRLLGGRGPESLWSISGVELQTPAAPKPAKKSAEGDQSRSANQRCAGAC